MELRRPIDARQVWVKVPPTNKRTDMAVPYQELAEVEQKAKAYTDSAIKAIPPPTPQSIGAIANSEKAIAGGIASLDVNAKVPLNQIPQSILDRLITLEAQVASLIASQQTPTPTPTPTPSGTIVYTFDYAALNSSKFAASGSQIAFGITDGGATVVRNAGGYSGLNSTMSASVSLQPGNYQLICNCRIESGSSHQIYWGSGAGKITKAISNTSYGDVSLNFSLSTAVTNFAPFGEENHTGGTVAAFIKNFRIVKLP